MQELSDAPQRLGITLTEVRTLDLVSQRGCVSLTELRAHQRVTSGGQDLSPHPKLGQQSAAPLSSDQFLGRVPLLEATRRRSADRIVVAFKELPQATADLGLLRHGGAGLVRHVCDLPPRDPVSSRLAPAGSPGIGASTDEETVAADGNGLGTPGPVCRRTRNANQPRNPSGMATTRSSTWTSSPSVRAAVSGSPARARPPAHQTWEVPNPPRP